VITRIQPGGKEMNRNQRQCAARGPLATKMLLVALVVCCAPARSFAGSVTILFDLVKVTTTFDSATGFNLYTASPVGKGPYETKDGDTPIKFFQQKPNGAMPMFLNGFTGAGIVANQFDFRYFGSVAASKGSILRNFTNIEYEPQAAPPGYSVKMVTGHAIAGFVIKLAQPTQDDVDAADGGNAFKAKIAADKKSVTFSDGNIPVANFPAVGSSADYLWSFISPVGDQPKFPAVMFTTPTIPPDPTGEFKNVKYVGMAVATPEPSSLALMVIGLAGIGLVARLRGEKAGAVESH
jgi:hypothetical protein